MRVAINNKKTLSRHRRVAHQMAIFEAKPGWLEGEGTRNGEICRENLGKLEQISSFWMLSAKKK